jgi:hypothetical protein|tara:strand:- start:153 stop:755 length:603 start_codon:yes stop_codon:yes gene_type:complete
LKYYAGILTITKVYLQIKNICSKLVKPILIVGGAIPIILAIIIVIPLVTAPEIANTAIDPLDESEIEFTVHQLRNISPGIIDRLTAEQTEIIIIKNDGTVNYTITKDGTVSPEKTIKIDESKRMKLVAMIKETGFLSIPFESFSIKDDIESYQKFGLKITLNENSNQLYWPEPDATDQMIPPIITMVQEELELIMEIIRE